MPEKALTQEEQKLLDSVPQALHTGVELLEWWKKADATNSYAYRYDETRTFTRPKDRSYGFFDTVRLSTGEQKINGNVQTMFYDEPKSPPPSEGNAAEWINAQVRKFILRYFMRISDFRQPKQVPETHKPTPPGMGFLSMCNDEAQQIGFGFSQLYYKRPNGEYGCFSAQERETIVDLETIGEEYEWIVLKNPIFNFKFDVAPLGIHAPQLSMPLVVSNYLVMSKAFIVDEGPTDDRLGRYGFGYAFVRDPMPTALGYGPGELEPAFELLTWEVDKTGEVTSRAVFVANEPEKMLNLSIDPFAWGFQLTYAFGTPEVQEMLQPFRRFYNSLPMSKLRFDPVFPALKMLNLLTFNQAEERLCISVDTVRKMFLFLHFKQHYDTILGSLQTWRQIPDWCIPEEELPAFVRTGKSS